MSFPVTEVIPYVKIATPPLVGAFIGYLTNKVAIRMLFRPLKAWHLFGIRVPMTPGVIPSKRANLAENMGEVVGDHLLTSTEIGNALKEERFQQHLLNVIAERVGAILHRDLPPAMDLIPAKYESYADLGIRSLKHQLKEHIHAYVQSEKFGETIGEALDAKMDHFLNLEVGGVLADREREAMYDFFEKSVARMFTSPVMGEWCEGFVRQKVYGALRQEKTLAELVPASLLEYLEGAIEEKLPGLLQRLATVLSEPDIRDRIVNEGCGAVQKFIESMGPMAAMAQSFISMEMVEEKIREYLEEKEDDIAAWLSSEEVRGKVAAILTERFAALCATPLVQLVKTEDEERIDDFCRQASRQIMLVLQGKEVSEALAAMVKANIESHLAAGEVTLQTALTELMGGEGLDAGRKWLKEETVALLRSSDTRRTLDAMLDAMVESILQRRIGKLSDVLPSDVRAEIYLSIRAIATTMLEQEVPGVVDSLDINRIVAERLNSLDLLRLEKLLLSIMEEHFKYINLFGALLGFLIGCGNLLLMFVR